MPSSFTSYWGSTMHGVEITWTNDLSSPVTLALTYTANLYWYMPMWYDSTKNSGDELAGNFSSTGNNAIDMNGVIGATAWTD